MARIEFVHGLELQSHGILLPEDCHFFPSQRRLHSHTLQEDLATNTREADRRSANKLVPLQRLHPLHLAHASLRLSAYFRICLAPTLTRVFCPISLMFPLQSRGCYFQSHTFSCSTQPVFLVTSSESFLGSPFPHARPVQINLQGWHNHQSPTTREQLLYLLRCGCIFTRFQLNAPNILFHVNDTT